MQLRTCYNCKFIKSNEDPDEWRFGGSEETPPDSFTIYCAMSHWSYYEGPTSELRKCLSTAEDCKDFEYIDYLPPLVTHKAASYLRPAPPKCKKCQSRLHKYYDKWSTTQITHCPVCLPIISVIDDHDEEIQSREVS